jgi:hypothetical protein
MHAFTASQNNAADRTDFCAGCANIAGCGKSGRLARLPWRIAMRAITTTALLLALGSSAAIAAPVAVDSGLATAGQAPIGQVQYYYPDPYYAPGPYYGPGYYGAPYYGPGPYYYGPAAVGAAVGGLVGGAVAGAAGAVAGAAAPGAVVAAPAGEPVIDVAYCQRRFRSYDVRSQTYMGSDGIRHPCPN